MIHVLDERVVVDDFWAEPMPREFTIPWASCSRETQLRAIGKLPDLLGRIFREAEQLVGDAEEAACQMEEILV
jgi:hypothetical protein